MQDGDLELLLEESRAWNAAHGITGLLAYVEGISSAHEEARFMQSLEGSKEEVIRIFEKIRNDSRHHDIVILKKGSIEHRNFSEWTMKYEKINLSVNLNLQAFFSLDDRLLQSDDFKNADVALNLLKSF